jgi:choline dehydrogenase-like flavoprotein
VLSVPADDSDEALLEHCKKSLLPIWHFVGTCKMGKRDDESAVVDKNFRVKDIKKLKVVDLSVAAVLPNNHTQSTAYLIGETAAEKMIKEYAL